MMILIRINKESETAAVTTDYSHEGVPTFRCCWRVENCDRDNLPRSFWELELLCVHIWKIVL